MENTTIEQDEVIYEDANHIFKGSAESWQKILSEFDPKTARFMTEEELKNKTFIVYL